MFAIIRVGGKQYRVENGTQVLVDRLHVEEGDAVQGVEVLMVVDGDDTKIGTPTLEVPVGATAVRHHLGKKIRVFKYKAKKNYRRRIGSRPHQTLIRIDSIGGNSERNQPARAKTAAPVEVAPAATETVEVAPVATETVEVAPIATEVAPVAAETVEVAPVEAEAPAVVEAVAVVDADSQADAVEAIEEVPGVESVEIVEDSETNA